MLFCLLDVRVCFPFFAYVDFGTGRRGRGAAAVGCGCGWLAAYYILWVPKVNEAVVGVWLVCRAGVRAPVATRYRRLLVNGPRPLAIENSPLCYGFVHFT